MHVPNNQVMKDWDEIKQYFEEKKDNYDDEYKGINLKDGAWSKLSTKQRNLLKFFIMNTNKYDFVPEITRIYLSYNSRSNWDRNIMINWITDILQFSSECDQYEFTGDLFLGGNKFNDDHAKLFCDNINNGTDALRKRNEHLVYGYCKDIQRMIDNDIPEDVILIIFGYCHVTGCKLMYLRFGQNKFTYNGYKMLFNTIQHKFTELTMITMEPSFDDKCCKLLADFFLSAPDHPLSAIWLTCNKEITGEGVMILQRMIEKNIKNGDWEENVDTYEHKSFIMNFCGLKRSEVEGKYGVKLNARIDIDDEFS